VRDGVVELAARPPEPHALVVGLEAALAIADHGRPGPALLDYLGSLGEARLPWDGRATDLLFEVLQRGDARAWRFLDVAGVLERALPELADALRRRRDDPFVVDPASASRFGLVEQIREVVARDPGAAEQHSLLEHPDWLLLAALILETAGEEATPVEVARRLVKRLDLGAAAEQEIALLVGEPGLLRAAARRVDALDEERVFSLASHLDRPERARALYVLTLALAPVDPVERARLDELHARVLGALEQPDLTGREARNLLERRRAEAMRLVGDAPALRDVRDRIAHAPRAYLLAQDAADVARQAALLEPVPPRGQARARVSALPLDVAGAPIGSRVWRIEVACRDRAGLLAHVSGVLARAGLSVEEAGIATWPDGGALESFRVHADAGTVPDEEQLEQSIVDSFRRTLTSEPNPAALASFDDEASPWYTLCEIRAPDSPGLLHAITVGLAAAGADVHSARVRTVGGQALDTFEVTDRNGRKLDGTVKPLILTAITEGVRAARRPRLVRRNGR
jgi:[protein-PII] uridylyltransferase